MTEIAAPTTGASAGAVSPATTGAAPVPAAASGADETYTDMIMRELEMLQLCLGRVVVKVAALNEVADDLDARVTFVDEEATRVEAPRDTRTAMDAAATVANILSRHAREAAKQTETTIHLTILGRDAMRPAVVVQDEMRAVGAGPKIHATARSN